MTKYLSKISLFCSLLFLFAFSIPSWAETAPASSADQTWHYVNAQGELKIKLYFFWSKTCPHCAEAHPLLIHYRKNILDRTRIPYGVRSRRAGYLANYRRKTTTEARSVPYMASCEKAVVGYSSEAVTGEFLVNRLKIAIYPLAVNSAKRTCPPKALSVRARVQKPMRRYLAPAAQILAKAPAMPPAW